MSAPTTTDELLALIRKSELVAPSRLDSLAGGCLTLTPREALKQFVADGLLTQFHAEQLLQGKWRGFTIAKYRVLERIGSGGMGTVYLCEHMLVGHKVAVKVLPTSQASNPSALGRFYREARAAGVIDHPNLVKAHDIDEENGLHFLVMDYVDGANLQDIVTRYGPLGVDRAAHYIRQTARGLQAAHEAGLIHRDIKPANIMVERNGNVRLLDLGLARFYNDNTDLLTLKYDERNVLGTADYVSPEQALNSHEVDIRTDIYSLGGTFYFCLTGKPPFPDGKIAQKLIWHQVRQPTPVRQLRPQVPEAIEAIIERMMAKEPEDRYQSPLEVIEALGPHTRRPIGPPPPREMPRLSPAALDKTPGPGQRETMPLLNKSRSSAQGVNRPALRPSAEINPPRFLPAPTQGEEPRSNRIPAAPAPPVNPSQLLEGKPAPEPNQGTLLMVLIAASLALGVGLFALGRGLGWW